MTDDEYIARLERIHRNCLNEIDLERRRSAKLTRILTDIIGEY